MDYGTVKHNDKTLTLIEQAERHTGRSADTWKPKNARARIETMTKSELLETYEFPSISMAAEMHGISLSHADLVASANRYTLQQYPNLESYQEAFPVGQDFHTGKWGFVRYAGGLDLRCCRYPSKAYAEKVRDSEYAKLTEK